MALFRRQRPTAKTSLTAAGMRVKRGQANTLRRLQQPWQTRAFAYYDLLGEIKYASQFYSRALSQLGIYAGTLQEDGSIVESTNDAAKEALDRIRDPGGGRSQLLSTYGRLMFLAGECYLFVSENPDTGLEQWEMLSTDELRLMDGVYMRYRAPSLMADEYREAQESDDPKADWLPVEGKNAVAYRLWRRHPRYSYLPDSTMQGVLDLCEELVLLTQAVRARARSRVAGNGILAIADEFSPAPLEPTGDEDLMNDPFFQDLAESMMAPIDDEGSASAVVPMLLRGPAAAIEKGIRHIQLIDPTQLYPETGLRRECIERLAIGLDMPPEVLTGLEDSNHWTAWQIDEQTWKSHLQPVAQQLVDDLTSAYYQPALREAGVTDWQNEVIAYDAAAIVNHPDRTKDAKELYGLRAIGKKALREAAGFDEDDAPERDELAEMVGIAVRDSSLAWYGIPSVRAGGLEPAPGEVESAAGTVDAGGTDTGAGVEPGPPASGMPDEPEDTPGSVVGSAELARVVGAADLAVLRAREAAGNRLKSLAKRDAALLAEIEGVRPREVAAVLGPERVAALTRTAASELVRGAEDLVEDALRLWGIEGEAAELLADQVLTHAVRTLWEPQAPPLPAAFAKYAAGVISAARDSARARRELVRA